MNAAEHYAEAVQIFDNAEVNAAGRSDEWYGNAMAAAQVQATLALACTIATALEPLARANVAGRN